MSTAKLVVLQPSKQQLADYANALLTVNSYAYAITNQQMPVLNYPPKNYGNFVSEFAPAKQHALNWSNNIFVNIVQLPKTIKQQAGNLFNMESTMIEAYLQMLIADPTNAQAKKGLESALTTVQTIINQQVTTITTIESDLVTFSTNIAQDAKILTNIAQNALTDATSDQALIEKLNTNISNLRGEIKTAQTLLTVSEIGIGVSIFVGLVGAVVCFIPGAQVAGGAMIAVAVAGTAASIAGTVIEHQRIKAMQKEILSDQKQITGLNQDIILLQGISTQFNELYNANLKAQNALTSIKDMWKSLDTIIGEVKNELAQVEKDKTAADYQKALSDFKLAEQNWKDVVAFADALAGINYSWQDANGNWHRYGSQNPSINSGKMNNITNPQAVQTA